ncbi:hypothetical protein D3C80_1320470 [compost metagenome]
MAALSASRLVCPAIAPITSSTRLISLALLASCSISAEVPVTSSTRCWIDASAWLTWSRPSRVVRSAPLEASAVLTALLATSSTAAVIWLTAVAAWSISALC